MGTMRKRKKRAIIRPPSFYKHKHPEKCFHGVLMLYVPWRHAENNLLMPYKTHEAHFHQKQDEIIRNTEYFEKESGFFIPHCKFYAAKIYNSVNGIEWHQQENKKNQIGFNVCPDMLGK